MEQRRRVGHGDVGANVRNRHTLFLIGQRVFHDVVGDEAGGSGRWGSPGEEQASGIGLRSGSEASDATRDCMG